MKPTINLEQLVSNLAQAIAYKACEKKDIKTTAEGRSALKYHYANARKMVEQVVKEYLKTK